MMLNIKGKQKMANLDVNKVKSCKAESRRGQGEVRRHI